MFFGASVLRTDEEQEMELFFNFVQLHTALNMKFSSCTVPKVSHKSHDQCMEKGGGLVCYQMWS